jgi:drug/metabolite transporter (DMT)-like permease
MSWILLIVLSTLLFSLSNLFHRVVMRDVKSDPYAQTCVYYGLGGCLTLALAIARGHFQYVISFQQLPFFVFLTIGGMLAPVCKFTAVKYLEASESSILLSSQNLWEVILAFIALQEAFSAQRLLGTVVVLLGIAIAQWRKKRFVFNRAVIFALLASILYALDNIVGYYVLRDFDAFSFNAYTWLLPSAATLCIRPQIYKKLSFYLRPNYLINLCAVACTATLGSIFIARAYQVARNASQLAPISASGTIVTVIFAILILKERTYMRQKIGGAIVVVIGLLLLA